MGAAVGVATYSCATCFFPCNSACIIQNLEVCINNQTIFNLPDYNLLWNKLYDYTYSQDSIARSKCWGETTDPSAKTFFDPSDGLIKSQCGYAMGNNSNDTAKDKDTYIIRSWLGPFSSASTQVIDATLLQ